MGFCDVVHILSRYSHPSSFSPGGEMGTSLLYYFTLSFILSHVCCPSSTCRVNLSKTDICPGSLIPELLGMVDKAEEYCSVRCRVLSRKGSKGNFPKIF